MYAEPDVTVPIGFVTGVHEPSPHGQLYDAKCYEWKQLCGQLRQQSDQEVAAARVESEASGDLLSRKRLDYAKNSRTSLNLEINAFEVELDLLINMNNLDVFMQKFDAHRQKLIENFNARKSRHQRSGIPRRTMAPSQPDQRQRSPPAEPVGPPRRAIPVRMAAAQPAAAPVRQPSPVPQLTRAQLAADKHRQRLETQRSGLPAPVPSHPSVRALAHTPLDEQRAQQVTRRTQTAQQKHMQRLQADNIGAGIPDVQADWQRYQARAAAEQKREQQAEELRRRRSAEKDQRLQANREERRRKEAADKAKYEQWYAEQQAEIEADEVRDRDNRRQFRRALREAERDPMPVVQARSPVAGPSRALSPVAGPSRGPSPVARAQRPPAISRLVRPAARPAPVAARPAPPAARPAPQAARRAPPAAPAAGTAAQPEAIWLRYYDEICTEIESLNEQLQETYQEVQDAQNIGNCAAKMAKFLVDRDHNRRLIIDALRSDNPDLVAEVTFRAIRPLEGEQFMCNDINDPENQALVLRIRALPRRIEDTLDTMRWSMQGGREPAARGQSSRAGNLQRRPVARPPRATGSQQHAVADASPASIEAARRNAAERLQNIDHPPGAVRTISSTSMLNASRRYVAEAGAAEAAEADAAGGAISRRPQLRPPINEMLLTGSATKLAISAGGPSELERSMRRTNEEFEEMLAESPGRSQLRDKLYKQLTQTKRSSRRPTSAVDIRTKLLAPKKPAKYVSAYRQSPRVRPPPSEGESGYHRSWLQNLNQTLAEESLQAGGQKPPPLHLRDTQVRDYLFDEAVQSQMDDLDLSMHIAMQLHDNPEGRQRYEQSARQALKYPDTQLDWVRQDMGIGGPQVDYSEWLEDDESEAEDELTMVEQQQQQPQQQQEPVAGDTDSERGVAGAIAVAQALNDSIQGTAVHGA